MSSISAPLARTARVRPVVPVAFVLGRAEARRLLRHPASILGLVLGLAGPVVATWTELPVLNRFDALVAESLIPFAVGVLIAAHLGTMRARRHRTTELFDSLAASNETMTAGHLIAVFYAAAFALMVTLVELAYMKAIGGVTAPRPEVVLGGPAIVLFGGAFGVALGRWAPRLFAAPLGLAGIVAACTAVTTNTYAHEREWLSLWVPSEVLAGVTSEFSLHPHGWRLLYVTGLMIVAAAMAFGQIRRLRVGVLGLALLAAAGAAFAGHGTMRPVQRGDQMAFAVETFEDSGGLSCREHSSVRYCAIPGYESWIDRWRVPVEGVLGALPSTVNPGHLNIIQSPSNESWGEHANAPLVRYFISERKKLTPGSGPGISPSLNWGRNSHEGQSELALALRVAADVTGVDSRFRFTEADIAKLDRPRRYGYRVGQLQRYCYALEQGRSVVVLWLAAQATDGSEAALRRAVSKVPFVADGGDDDRYFSAEQWVLQEYEYETTGRSNVTWGTREATYAEQLLDRDEAEVQAAIAANWDRLVDPATTSDEAASILGLAPLPSLETGVESSGYFRRYRGVEQFGTPQCH